MPRNRRIPSMTLVPKPRSRKLVSKELDLLLLAGCSCLLTVMYHPVADALQSAQSAHQSNGAIAAHSAKTSTTQTSSFYLSLPPKRDEIQPEDEQA